jgi:hypothetical protein
MLHVSVHVHEPPEITCGAAAVVLGVLGAGWSVGVLEDEPEGDEPEGPVVVELLVAELLVPDVVVVADVPGAECDAASPARAAVPATDPASSMPVAERTRRSSESRREGEFMSTPPPAPPWPWPGRPSVR